MFKTIQAVLQGLSVSTERQVSGAFAIDMIEGKIRQAEQGVAAGKQTLAALVVRHRTESRLLARLKADITDLETRARAAAEAGRLDLVQSAAEAIAELENERLVHEQSTGELGARVERMRLSIEKAHRRMIELRQGLIAAKAVDAERRAQRQLNRSLGRTTAMHEAQTLIAQVMNGDDPLEQAAVLDEIDARLTPGAVRERLARAGFGDRQRIDASDVIARLALPTTTYNNN